MSTYNCRRCNYSQPTLWEGSCPGCHGLYRAKKVGVDSAEQKSRATFGTTIKVPREYIPTGQPGFDSVIGGGLVVGRVILMGGFPGAGKTTLLCAVADGIAKTKGQVIYASGEESAEAVQEVADRLGLVNDKVEVMGNQQSVETTLAKSKELKAFLTIFDSAQKFASDFSGGSPGSQAQCKAIGEAIAKHCRTTKTCAVIVNQMSSDGFLKGGTELEHHCDTIMVLGPPRDDDEDAPEGKDIRILTNSKNRVGPENLSSYWQMTETGVLEHIPPKSKLIELPTRRRHR